MSVEFENDEHHKSILYAKLLQPTDEAPSIIGWLKKTGIVQTDEGANKILICVMFISLLMTTVTVYKSFFADSRRFTAEEDKKFQEQLESIHHRKQQL